MSTGPDYIPAARWRAFSRLYDPVFAATMREVRFRGEMLSRADEALSQGGTAIDVGCGTGTFAIALAARRADARVIGIDGDQDILAIAERKPGAERVEWKERLADDLPTEDDSVDVATISMVLHHLLPAEKRKALAEMHRALRPGGRLLVTDWGTPHDPVMSAIFFVSQAVDGFERTADHRGGRIPEFLAEAGFGEVERYDRLRTAFGSIDLLSAKRLR